MTSNSENDTVNEDDFHERLHKNKQFLEAVKMNRWSLFIPQMLQFFVWVPARILLKVCVSFRFTGTENLKELARLKKKNKIKGVLFAANHQSELDPIAVRAAMPPVAKHTPLFYVARVREYYRDKKFLEKYFYGGRFFRWWGAYPAYSGFKNYRESLTHHLRLLKNHKSILIFPEGKRTRTGELGKPHGGVAFLAHELKLPVIPVSITGAHKFRGMKDFFFGCQKVHVHFGEIMFPKDVFTETQLNNQLSPESYHEAAAFILARVREAMDENKK